MSSASLPPDIDSGVTMVVRERFSYKAIRDVLSGLLEQDLHAKRVSSLCDATLGVLHSGSLAICTILESLGFAPQESPHLSDRSKNVGEEWLVPQHLGEALHQRAQPIITHCGQ